MFTIGTANRYLYYFIFLARLSNNSFFSLRYRAVLDCTRNSKENIEEGAARIYKPCWYLCFRDYYQRAALSQRTVQFWISFYPKRLSITMYFFRILYGLVGDIYILGHRSRKALHFQAAYYQLKTEISNLSYDSSDCVSNRIGVCQGAKAKL
jgi:hypothetical protein